MLVPNCDICKYTGLKLILSGAVRATCDRKKLSREKRHEDHTTRLAGRSGGRTRRWPVLCRGGDRRMAVTAGAADLDLCRRRLERHLLAHPRRVFRGPDGPEILRREQAG